MRKIIARNPPDANFWHQYRAISHPNEQNKIIVCSESMFKDEIIDWSAYQGEGDPHNAKDVIRVAETGDKIYQSQARSFFPDQIGIWRD